jgi:hypothetical protein
MIRFVVFLIYYLFTFTVTAQKSSYPKDTTERTVMIKRDQSAANPILDTDESLKYMGGLLLFEVKKRLNLTTREEELEAMTEKKKKVRLSIGGIVVER